MINSAYTQKLNITINISNFDMTQSNIEDMCHKFDKSSLNNTEYDKIAGLQLVRPEFAPCTTNIFLTLLARLRPARQGSALISEPQSLSVPRRRRNDAVTRARRRRRVCRLGRLHRGGSVLALVVVVVFCRRLLRCRRRDVANDFPPERIDLGRVGTLFPM